MIPDHLAPAWRSFFCSALKKRCSEANARAFAKRDNLTIPETPAHQAKNLLQEFKGLVSRLWDGFHSHRDDEARALHAALEDADDLVKKVEPVLEALNVPQS